MMTAVIAVRYRNATPCQGDERSVDALLASGVLDVRGVRPQVFTPVLDSTDVTDDIPTNIGKFCRKIANDVARARRSGQRVIMIGGDCTHVTGMYAGLTHAHGPNARIGLVWFDAHGDFNTQHTTLSGMLGGMPVAVCAGLTWPQWREHAGIRDILPTNRIVMVDVRNLDPAEETLIRATDVTVVPCQSQPLREAMQRLVATCDYIYLHIDEDILDQRYVPNHGTAEPNGPSMDDVKHAVSVVAAVAGEKLIAQALVSVYNVGEGAAISVASGIELLAHMRAVWPVIP
jgi:arginase